eukprot:CAMPEP_0181059348 /NCGR_PEP_ID=MMETSP1070-20121207/21332_1 /TAXON_ID=265543 /ORGANISM="Minutocellus polymorphus, Strain NH13" /LENGTH=245 /DNA_ID=CAMNT_0023139015 /DNA_START=1713 /DNA_END=2450 /DNA_ORIENTATION=-
MAGDGKRGGRPSTRCASHDCDACRLWLAAKDLPKGKRRNREVIKAQKNHPCPRTAASQKKQRRGEAALLSAGGRGGQYRSSEVDVAALPDAAPSHKIGAAPPPAQSADTRGTSRRRSAAGIAEGIVVGSDVVLRMHPDERRLNPEDEYFVGSVVEPAMKLDAPACYGTNSFYKNDWIVKIRWYELSSIEQNGDRMYKRGNMQFLNVKMVVQNLTRQIKLDHKGRGKYCLAKNLDDHIVQHGDINT